jgi:hypothetical protein
VIVLPLQYRDVKRKRINPITMKRYIGLTNRSSDNSVQTAPERYGIHSVGGSIVCTQEAN